MVLRWAICMKIVRLLYWWTCRGLWGDSWHAYALNSIDCIWISWSIREHLKLTSVLLDRCSSRKKDWSLDCLVYSAIFTPVVPTMRRISSITSEIPAENNASITFDVSYIRRSDTCIVSYLFSSDSSPHTEHDAVFQLVIWARFKTWSDSAM